MIQYSLVDRFLRNVDTHLPKYMASHPRIFACNATHAPFYFKMCSSRIYYHEKISDINILDSSTGRLQMAE
jgi:hypothetical protein